MKTEGYQEVHDVPVQTGSSVSEEAMKSVNKNLIMPVLGPAGMICSPLAE